MQEFFEAVEQEPVRRFGQVEGLSDGWDDQGGVTDGSERNEVGILGEGVA
jgi:hypothetical protein